MPKKIYCSECGNQIENTWECESEFCITCAENVFCSEDCHVSFENRKYNPIDDYNA